jgi:hypothetical protein
MCHRIDQRFKLGLGSPYSEPYIMETQVGPLGSLGLACETNVSVWNSFSINVSRMCAACLITPNIIFYAIKEKKIMKDWIQNLEKVKGIPTVLKFVQENSKQDFQRGKAVQFSAFPPRLPFPSVWIFFFSHTKRVSRERERGSYLWGFFFFSPIDDFYCRVRPIGFHTQTH